MNTKLFIPVAAIALVGIATFGVGQAFAQSATTPQVTIIDKIATKFNLNKTQVQAVFDEQHATRQAEMQKRYEDMLATAVKDGKITESQKNALIAKHNEIKANMQSQKEAFKDLTPEARREKMEAKRTELEAWAKAQGVDIKYLFGLGHGRMGHRGMMGKGWMK